MDKNDPYEYPSIHQRLIGYPYRVWILSILVTPLLSMFWNLAFSESGFEFSTLHIILFLFALSALTATSAPSLFIYLFVFWKLASSKTPVRGKKFLLFVTGAVCFLFTNLLLRRGFGIELFSFNATGIDLIIFFVIFFTLSFLFKLK